MKLSLTYFLLAFAFLACKADPIDQPDLPKDGDNSENENSDSSEESRIVGGSPAYLGQFKYQASLRDSNGGHFCGGTIISNSFILTAAHCVSASVPHHTVVGTIYRTSTITKYMIANRIRHSGFNPSTLANDIAVVKTSTPIVFNQYVQPAKLPQNYPTAGTKLYASGWGATNLQGTNPADILQYFFPYVLSDTECARYRVPAGVMCTFLVRGRGICFGDSGGPFAFDNVVYGISSFIFGSCAAGYPDGTTSVRYFRPWICSNTGLC